MRILSAARCQKPVAVDTNGYNPDTGINSAPNGEIRDDNTDAMSPIVGKFLIDMTVTPRRHTSNLLLAILHLFGLSELQTVGTPDYSRGVLPNLTSLT